jgi:hypothetical protein
MTSINKLIEAHERLTTVLKPKTSASKDPSGAIQEVKELYMHHKHQDCSKRAIVYISELGHNVCGPLYPGYQSS